MSLDSSPTFSNPWKSWITCGQSFLQTTINGDGHITTVSPHLLRTPSKFFMTFIVFPKLSQCGSWFVTHLYCLTKSVMWIAFLESLCNSLVHRLDEQHTIQWQIHYFDTGMKIVHEWRMACSTVKQQKNVEWDIFLQEIFLYLQDKVLGKQVLENGLCKPDFGVTLTHNGKRALGYVLRALAFSEW